jgi:hypothetical protein
MFDLIINWLKARLHIKATELRNAPGVHDPKAAADHVNSVLGTAIDAAAPAGIAAIENAVTVRPDSLKGAPGIADHALAADVINAVVKSKIEGG